MKFVPRIEWGAIEGDTLTGLLTSMVTVHWGGSPSGNPKHDRCAAVVRSFQSYHIKTQGWADIAYNLVVCAHGYVFEGRGRGKRSAANGDYDSNSASYAICYMGGAGEPFTAEAKAAINEAALFLVPSGPTWRVHQDWVETGCPGVVITDWVRSGHPSSGPAPTPTPVPQEDDEMNLPYFFDAPPSRGEGIWMASGIFRKTVHAVQVWSDFEAMGAKHIGVAPVALFDSLINADELARVTA